MQVGHCARLNHEPDLGLHNESILLFFVGRCNFSIQRILQGFPLGWVSHCLGWGRSWVPWCRCPRRLWGWDHHHLIIGFPGSGGAYCYKIEEVVGFEGPLMEARDLCFLEVGFFKGPAWVEALFRIVFQIYSARTFIPAKNEKVT